MWWKQRVPLDRTLYKRRKRTIRSRTSVKHTNPGTEPSGSVFRVRLHHIPNISTEITDKDETIIKVSETKNETEMLDMVAAVVNKAFGLTENEKQ